jgi:large conductance mechanosensitive channel
VADIIMPPIGLLTGGVDFTKLQLALAEGDKAPVIKYGLFLQNCVDFLVIAFTIFLVVRQINKMREPAAS